MIRFSTLFHSLIVSTGLALAAASASAQMDMHDHARHNTPAAATQDDAHALAAGDIQRVDKATRKLTVQHGPLTNLGMPGMTMALEVQDAGMLDQVKAGDKVRLRVERVNGTYTITTLEAAN